MSGPFKMKGSGKVYYEGSGDSIMLNEKDLGKVYKDEHGNKARDHKGGDVFYLNKPRFGGSKEGPVVPIDWWKQERNVT